jgi:hypothetical protein
VVLYVPLLVRPVGIAQRLHVIRADVVGGDVGLLLFVVDAGIARIPVVSIECDSQ